MKNIGTIFKKRWRPELISRSMVRLLPAMDQQHHFLLSRYSIALELLKEFKNLKGVPRFYMDQKEKWTFSKTSGILIPLLNYEGNIYRLRIHLDYLKVDKNGKEKGKYQNFSSFYEIVQKDGSIINKYQNGCKSGTHIGFYGNCSKDDFRVYYITEGEKKAIYANNELHAPIISVPGVNSFHK